MTAETPPLTEAQKRAVGWLTGEWKRPVGLDRIANSWCLSEDTNLCERREFPRREYRLTPAGLAVKRGMGL